MEQYQSQNLSSYNTDLIHVMTKLSKSINREQLLSISSDDIKAIERERRFSNSLIESLNQLDSDNSQIPVLSRLVSKGRQLIHENPETSFKNYNEALNIALSKQELLGEALRRGQGLKLSSSDYIFQSGMVLYIFTSTLLFMIILLWRVSRHKKIADTIRSEKGTLEKEHYEIIKQRLNEKKTLVDFEDTIENLNSQLESQSIAVKNLETTLKIEVEDKTNLQEFIQRQEKFYADELKLLKEKTQDQDAKKLETLSGQLQQSKDDNQLLNKSYSALKEENSVLKDKVPALQLEKAGLEQKVLILEEKSQAQASEIKAAENLVINLNTELKSKLENSPPKLQETEPVQEQSPVRISVKAETTISELESQVQQYQTEIESYRNACNHLKLQKNQLLEELRTAKGKQPHAI